MRLELETGEEVEALVRTLPGETQRAKCLLLHGNPGSIAAFEQLVPRLAGALDIAAIDLPGFGKSRRRDPSPAGASLDRLAETVIAAANALDWRAPFFVIGHSHGGGVAQVVAARHPDRVAGLVLIATMGAPANASYRLLSLPGAAALAKIVGQLFRCAPLRALNRAILRAAMADIFSPEAVDAERLERELQLLSERPEILSSMVHVTHGRPSAQLLRSAADIRCPTLFLHGSEDALVPASHARVIHERIAKGHGRSQFHLLPGAGHMLIHYQASELAELIIASLSGRPARDSARAK